MGEPAKMFFNGCNMDCFNCPYPDCYAPENYSNPNHKSTSDDFTKLLSDGMSIIEYMEFKPETSVTDLCKKFHTSAYYVKKIFAKYPEMKLNHDRAVKESRKVNRPDVIEYMRNNPRATISSIRRLFRVSSDRVYRIWECYPEIRTMYESFLDEKQLEQLAANREKYRLKRLAKRRKQNEVEAV
jgi:hypothetical protein